MFKTYLFNVILICTYDLHVGMLLLDFYVKMSIGKFCQVEVHMVCILCQIDFSLSLKYF